MLELLEIDSRQRVVFGIHPIRQVPKGASRRVAESGEIRLVLGPDYGHDLVFVSHYDYKFRRQDIARVGLGRAWKFDDHELSLSADGPPEAINQQQKGPTT